VLQKTLDFKTILGHFFLLSFSFFLRGSGCVNLFQGKVEADQRDETKQEAKVETKTDSEANKH